MQRILTFLVLGMILSYSSSAAISGTLSCCAGGTSTLAGTPTGGAWMSSAPAIASVSSGGVVTGITAGTAQIFYSVGATTDTVTFTVNPNPALIGGPGSICAGTPITYTDAIPGGIWSSSTTITLTVSATTGVAIGTSAGVATITYTLPTGCFATHAVTVDSSATPAAITGASSVCAGATTTLTDASSGGTWSSSSSSTASVGITSGIVSGVSAGIATITYTRTNACGTGVATHIVTVGATVTAGTITGTTTLAAGDSVILTDAVPGGMWSSSNPSIATIDASGEVHGVSGGVSTITYTVSGCGGPAHATTVVTVTAVTPIDGISGDVLFTGTPYSGSVKVWLITYNATTHMLQAVDSLLLTSTGTSVHYSFTGVATDTFRVKAATYGSAPSATGYMPTYYTSSSVWSSATVIPHTSGTADVSKNITMISGIAATGPGFISGDVTMGANKGTAGSVPAVGMLMYLENNSSGTILQQTYTDAAGHYSFNNLMVGQVYRVYPELINYGTTPYTTIILTTSNPAKYNVSFEQHTISHTITPYVLEVNTVAENGNGIDLYPNPTTGKVNITWNAAGTDDALLIISDITGREVFTTNINSGTGSAAIDLSGLNDGMYMIAIKSASLSYIKKIQIAK